MKIGVFFGGSSREREVSFAGGRTVIDNLNKQLFETVPIFVDSSANRFILLDWQYLYKGTIRDFYPLPTLPETKPFQIYAESLLSHSTALEKSIEAIGKEIHPHQFSSIFDMAFLALHGPSGEDGSIQGLLEWFGIPYTGSGIFGSAIGISKTMQAELQQRLGLRKHPYIRLMREQWQSLSVGSIFARAIEELGLPFVVKSSTQGSSIGVSVVHTTDQPAFVSAIHRAFFMEEMDAVTWLSMSQEGRYMRIRQLTDIREGIGLPIMCRDILCFTPTEVLHAVDKYLRTPGDTLLLASIQGEQEILLESYVKGREFSCIVIAGESGEPIALPPTEILKRTVVFDYRSKYLPGISRKVTPIDAPAEVIEQIRSACCALYRDFGFEVYARIDGFLSDDGAIVLNDPNTTSGMMPSSFFFHQAAEIGLNPSQFLTYVIRASLQARARRGAAAHSASRLLHRLEDDLQKGKGEISTAMPVAVIMGGYSSERHISMESGRNIYEKLASSGKYAPIPIFLTGSTDAMRFFELPIHILLKDNADDIANKVLKSAGRHPTIEQIVHDTAELTDKFRNSYLRQPMEITLESLAHRVQFAFIALHGRPGEDGALQSMLEGVGIPYNGSRVESAQVTMNKYETNKRLAAAGIPVATHLWCTKSDWERNPEAWYAILEQTLGYPMILKPADDGCSSAVKKIKNRGEMEAYTTLLFRHTEEIPTALSQSLQLAPNEEFPRKFGVLAEQFIDKGDAEHFLEITGGFLSTFQNGKVHHTFFEPSEVLATGEVLSLEEKFLAGEGQNITPARFDKDPAKRDRIAAQVKQDLAKAAGILGVEGYGRMDAFVRIYANDAVETIIIEMNSLPGMTPATCIFHQCALEGYTPFEFIDQIIRFGIERHKNSLQV
jgi:D-alanine-D-alanine ligase